MLRRHALVAALGIWAALVVAGCSSSGPTARPASGQDDLLGHVHGLGVDPADGALYVASHMGVFRRGEEGELARVADRWQDTMAFTVVGPGHFLASGHPDLREDLPPHLGLIESTDAAKTWDALSLQGSADFHALDVSGDFIYGFDAAAGALLNTDNGRRWRVMDRTPIADIAADPSDTDLLLATTSQGELLAYEVFAGTATPLEGAPPLTFLDWADGDSVVGATASGEMYLSPDRGQTWQRLPSVAGDVQALDAGPDSWHVATTHGIYRSSDGGRSWRSLT